MNQVGSFKRQHYHRLPGPLHGTFIYHKSLLPPSYKKILVICIYVFLLPHLSAGQLLDCGKVYVRSTIVVHVNKLVTQDFVNSINILETRINYSLIQLQGRIHNFFKRGEKNFLRPFENACTPFVPHSTTPPSQFAYQPALIRSILLKHHQTFYSNPYIYTW